MDVCDNNNDNETSNLKVIIKNKHRIQQRTIKFNRKRDSAENPNLSENNPSPPKKQKKGNNIFFFSIFFLIFSVLSQICRA